MIFMSRQDCAIEQSNTIAVKTDDEFQNIENIILTDFKCLRCGQGEYALRYNRCPVCDYLIDEMYIKTKNKSRS